MAEVNAAVRTADEKVWEQANAMPKRRDLANTPMKKYASDTYGGKWLRIYEELTSFGFSLSRFLDRGTWYFNLIYPENSAYPASMFRSGMGLSHPDFGTFVHVSFDATAQIRLYSCSQSMLLPGHALRNMCFRYDLARSQRN